MAGYRRRARGRRSRSRHPLRRTRRTGHSRSRRRSSRRPRRRLARSRPSIVKRRPLQRRVLPDEEEPDELDDVGEFDEPVDDLEF